MPTPFRYTMSYELLKSLFVADEMKKMLLMQVRAFTFPNQTSSSEGTLRLSSVPGDEEPMTVRLKHHFPHTKSFSQGEHIYYVTQEMLDMMSLDVQRASWLAVWTDLKTPVRRVHTPHTGSAI